MTATAEQRRRAADPATPPAELAELAVIPELQLAISANPACYDELLDWLVEHGSPEVRGVLAGDGDRRATERSRHGLAVGITVVAFFVLFVDGLGFVLWRVVFATWGVPQEVDEIANIAVEPQVLPAWHPLLTAVTRAAPLALLAFAILALPASRPARRRAWVALAIGTALLFLPAIAASLGSPLPDDLTRVLAAMVLASALAAWLLARERPPIAFAALALVIAPAVAFVLLRIDPGRPIWTIAARSGWETVAIYLVLTIGALVGGAWLAHALAERSRQGGTLTP